MTTSLVLLRSVGTVSFFSQKLVIFQIFSNFKARAQAPHTFLKNIFFQIESR